ncbi:MAG: hypothetical protein QM704_21525 [Anaeromyxobacteraceae bacterium]
MATWRVDVDESAVRLLYRDARGEQPCGESERCLESEVVAFACHQADPFDLIVLDEVTFVRQAAGSRA